MGNDGFSRSNTVGTEGMSYKHLLSKLSDRFGGQGIEKKYQHELRCKRRGRNETLRELAQEIQRLMSLAYPNDRSSLADHIARDVFLTVFDDAEFELKIRERTKGSGYCCQISSKI